MSLLYTLLVSLLQCGVVSLLRDNIMPQRQYNQYQLPFSNVQQNHDMERTFVRINTAKSYKKTTIGLNRVELSDTLYNILCEDKVLSQFSIKEYEQDDYRDYYKIEENENEYNVSIWVRSIKKNEYNIKHRMEWVLYCLPYVKQQPVDFTADIPYIPLADGCGCLFF